jgi:transposase
MDKQKKHGTSDQAGDKRFMERLRQHPELREHFEAILSLADAEGDEIRTVDDAEDRLVAEMRKLGNHTMTDFISRIEEKGVSEFRKQNPGTQIRKKKP